MWIQLLRPMYSLEYNSLNEYNQQIMEDYVDFEILIISLA